MTTKRKAAAVKKAAKTPTVKQLKKDISRDTAREATLKHDADTARSGISRKHDLAEARSVAKKVTTLKHELARKTKKKTGLALAPGDVSCCAAQALAASLRLALGVAVHDEDVLALYWRTAADPDEGASILATLEVAAEFGIAGVRLASFRPLHLDDDVPLPAGQFYADGFGELDHALGRGCHDGSIILGLDLPAGPHAVSSAPDGPWWSWGEPYSPEHFAGAVIEDAWAVTW